MKQVLCENETGLCRNRFVQVCAENETKDKLGCLHTLVFNHVRQEIKDIINEIGKCISTVGSTAFFSKIVKFECKCSIAILLAFCVLQYCSLFVCCPQYCSQMQYCNIARFRTSGLALYKQFARLE